MRSLTARCLACSLAVVGVLRSHLWPLTLLVLLGATLGLLLAVGRRNDPAANPRDVVRLPGLVAALVLVLVGVGQLGLLGLLVGVVLLALTPTLVPDSEDRS